MKILHYTGCLTRSAGGLFFSVSGLAKAQASAGHHVVVAGPTDSFYDEDVAQWGEVGLKPFEAWTGYGFHPIALRTISEMRPDVVHIHGIWNATSAYGRFAIARGVPTVVSPRGMIDPWILQRRKRAKQLHAELFERPLLKRSYVHALNTLEAKAVADFSPAAGRSTFVVPNGITLPLDTSPNARDRSGVLFIGRLHPKKQIEELVEAWPALGPQAPPLRVAGWGDPSYTRRVQERVEATPNVEFLGPLYGAAKAYAFSTAAFFILPSLSEGLPMAALEAISYGCTPILTPECNLPELHTSGVAIQIQSDLSDMAVQLERLFSESTEDLELRRARSLTAAAAYEWTSVSKRMIAAYEEVARSHLN